MAATSSSRWPRSRCRGNCSRTFYGSLRNCAHRPLRRRREAVDRIVFESKRQETCALMAEKAEVCGTDCGKTATPVGNNLSIPRFTHHPYCHCLLYTSDAADEEDSVDLGGRRIIKKK